mmetsp:Transcript_4725/g.16625  ORF Transcript_4725/g.16625 Transcript_4725/m.16625 type:complete len:217 (+) Transcript_4725:233-883(+)
MSEMIVSCGSKPELAASVLGIISSASANACTPSLVLPFIWANSAMSARWAAISNAPPPGTTHLSSTVFFTARSPSRTASLIWAMVWPSGPLMRMVHERGFATPSTNVNFSSPKVCTVTSLAKPSTSGVRPSSELTALPPLDRVRRSMLRRLALRRARMFSLASISSDTGSMPFMLTTTKPSPGLQTSLLSSMIFFTFRSVNLRSASANSWRWAAER